MLAMGTLMVVTLLVAGFVFLFRQQRLAQQKERLETCLNTLEDLKQTLLVLQQHRGLTTGCLVGDHALEDKVKIVRQKVEDQLRKAVQNNAGLEHDYIFEGVLNHWHRLRDRWPSQSVQNNISQHNRLILNLLFLIENQAEETPELVECCQQAGLTFIWKELLETIEAIGQARAVGTGAVAAGRASALERVRLRFLMERVTQKLDLLITGMASSESRVAKDSAAITQAREQSRCLKTFIEQELIHAHTINIETSQFFDLASAVIEPLDRFFSDTIQHLRREMRV